MERLWERLDLAIANREFHLEQAIGKYDKMQKTYDHLNKDLKRITTNLNHIKEQLNKVNIFDLLFLFLFRVLEFNFY